MHQNRQAKKDPLCKDFSYVEKFTHCFGKEALVLHYAHLLPEMMPHPLQVQGNDGYVLVYVTKVYLIATYQVLLVLSSP